MRTFAGSVCLALLSVSTMFSLASMGCTRTKTVEVPVIKYVPKAVATCALQIPDLPPRPQRVPCPEGSGLEICYGPGEAWALVETLDRLIDLYIAAKACQPATTAPTPPAPGSSTP